jgi:hypothetical protein
MITKTINLYSFDELSTEAQNKAIENLSDINVDHEWWDFVYTDFITIAEYFGIEIEKNRNSTQMFFTGFYSQGDGSAFAGTIDVQKFIECIEGEKWREHAPKEELKFYKVTPNIKRVCKLIASGTIDLYANVKMTNRETSVKLEYDWSFAGDYKCSNPIRVETTINDLIELLEDGIETLNSWFFNQLRTEYEYQTSREQIIETIKANEYTFTENGKLENL